MLTDSNTTQAFFAGVFHHAVDEKNRVTIPSRWRRAQAEEFIILPEKDEFLRVMSHEEFERVTAAAENDASISAHDRRVFLRHLHATAQHVTIDKQGRLVLPDDLCRLLHLNGEVTLVGGRGRFEIWNPARWKQAHHEQKATFQRVADVIGL
jgi:MraZ protein